MLQAADALAATEFSLAYTQQSEAMRALVEAKEDLTELAFSELSNNQRAAFARLLRELPLALCVGLGLCLLALCRRTAR